MKGWWLEWVAAHMPALLQVVRGFRNVTPAESLWSIAGALHQDTIRSSKCERGPSLPRTEQDETFATKST